jgi:hypothetical protein
MLSRSNVQHHLSSLFSNTAALSGYVEQSAELPDTVKDWMGRLKLLYGVPINYLVPDEGMLPPESIRFFHIDSNWIDALLDGAFSIGRNLAVSQTTLSFSMDRASSPFMNTQAGQSSAVIRAKALGVAAPQVSFKTITGFLLRSRLVETEKGMGVNPYPVNGTPTDPEPRLLNILRMERLGADSDTLLCLIEGDAYRIDIHQAPEALHYGVDSFEIKDNKVTSTKKIYTFTKEGSDPKRPVVVMDMKNPVRIDLVDKKCFRSMDQDPRTIKMQTLAKVIGDSQKQEPKKPLDASEMGFEMVEGVGQVSFYKKIAK